MDHVIDKVCRCSYCMKLDIMFGDPTLNAWESHFIASVAAYGCWKDYTKPQKFVIDKLFAKQVKKWERRSI